MFEIIFSAETVKLASEMYMKKLNLNNVTVEHEKKVSDIGIIESWITEDKKHDKINLYGVEPIVGGWAIMMKVNNDAEWSKVKDGQYTGFSIEGKFAGFENLQSKQINNNMDLVEELKAIINAELKSEKVHLGLVDDALNLYKKGLQSFDNASKLRVEVANKYLDSKDVFFKAIQDLQKVEKMAKDLGVDLPSNAKTALEESNRYLKIADQYIKDLK